MPGILSNMDVSNVGTAPSTDAPNRRKSGRAIHKPVLYQEDPNVSITTNGSAKRKREERVAADAGEEMGHETSSNGEESEPDEEELKENRRRKPKAKKVLTKPAAKKPKTAKDDAVKLAMRPVTNGVKKASKPRKPRARVSVRVEEASGLYGLSHSSQAFLLSPIPSR